MDEVEPERLVAAATQRDAELRKLVEVRLAGPPVVCRAPVLAHLLHIGQGDALRPVLARLALGPGGAGQSVGGVGEVGVADGDLEGCEGGHGVAVHRLPAAAAASTAAAADGPAE